MAFLLDEPILLVRLDSFAIVENQIFKEGAKNGISDLNKNTRDRGCEVAVMLLFLYKPLVHREKRSS